MLKRSFIVKGLLPIVLLLILGACKKKYPDGPLLSLSSKMKRITGSWALNAALVDGQYKTNYPGFASCRIKITDSHEYTLQWQERGLELNGLGTWEWYDHKRSVRFGVDLWFYKFGPDGNLVNNTYNNSQPHTITYRITRLTDNQLWLETTDTHGAHVQLGFVSN